jgi:Reverse transcriptase (RNA-dependent DNA polymerase)
VSFDNTTKPIHATPQQPDHHNSPYTTSHDYLRSLADKITVVELRAATFSMPNDKATGPDGLPIEFFKTYWETIWGDELRTVLAFHDNKLDLWRLNQRYISLIPKTASTTHIFDYRPISVLSSIPKIITKILATRLQKYLLQLVNQQQTAFVKGKQLMQTFISTRETLNHLAKNKIPSVFLKINFRKAFDTLSWDFLL